MDDDFDTRQASPDKTQGGPGTADSAGGSAMGDGGFVLDEAMAGDALAALLAWYQEMGVDSVLEDEPVDHFARAKAAASAPPRMTAASAPAAPSRMPAAPRPAAAPLAPVGGGGLAGDGLALIPGEEAIGSARAAAAAATSLDALKAALEVFEGCNLRRTAKSLVFGDGNPAGRLMLVGEAPGRDEDIEGRPFVGRSGQLLDRMLAAVGLSRAREVYIANVIYWRPPGNRDPSDQEVAICRPFILRQIELVQPDFLMFLGAQPAKALIGAEAAKAGIRRLRGRWLDFPVGSRTIPALPTFHPAYLLRNPIEKRLAWRDLLAVRAAMGGGIA